MAHYQVLARKYRPQTFRDVIGQEAIVTTLKNAIKRNRIAHAYLFCGSRGTGKTTLARIFAKSLNCQNPTEDHEPCNCCSSCKEITAGSSFDVLEIDGASHRGIDDIRQINETVGYSTASGKYKIYLIDEVHMLTKEAFNALLKTLEEPPPKVVFFFATTEPHKVLPTILSRCQRFNLNRISLDAIVQKLDGIAKDLGVSIQQEALRLLASAAEGGLRDAESLFDQVLAFHEETISLESVANILGIMPKEAFFRLDQAAKIGDFSLAFEMAHELFSQGKDVIPFIEDLIEHFRTILLLKIMGKDSPILSLTKEERERYEFSSSIYEKDQCLTILDFLVEARHQRMGASSRVFLESLLLRILRIHQRIPIDLLVRRLVELEQKVTDQASKPQGTTILSKQFEREEKSTSKEKTSSPSSFKTSLQSMTEDPTPSQEDLGIKAKKNEKEPSPIAIELGARPTAEARQQTAQTRSRYDTILQFAAVELNGFLQQ